EIRFHAGYGIHLHPEIRNVKTMQDVFRSDLETDGLIHGDYNLTSQLIIPAIFIIKINTQPIQWRCQSVIPFADLPIAAGVPYRPRELLADNLDEDGLLLGFLRHVGNRTPGKETE